MTVGEIIKEFVETKITDKSDYKKKLGMGYGAMHKYFTNQRLPGYKVLYRLKKAGFNLGSIFTKEVYESSVDESDEEKEYKPYA